MSATIIDFATRRALPPKETPTKRMRVSRRELAAAEETLRILPTDRPSIRATIERLRQIEAEGDPRDPRLQMTASMLYFKIWQMRDYGPGFYLDDPKPTKHRG